MPRDDAGIAAELDALREGMKPTILVAAGLLSQLVTEAEQAIIAARLPVYQRGRKLVRPATQEVVVSRGGRTLAACFSEITQPAALDYLCRAAAWIRYDGRAKAEVAIDPPRRVADVLLSRFGEWQFPAVSGIITCPTLRPDYSVLSEAGYDRATRLYLVHDPSLRSSPIPKRPTHAEAQEALKLLDGLLDGFPFVGPADRAVALSALLTPVCRGAMSVAPLHAFRANTAGSGKSYLADLASAIATGRPCPVAAAGRDQEETDKRLVALLLSGFPIVCLDNVNGELGSDLLCQAVERPAIRLRPLGASEIAEIETSTTLFANGNGLRVRGDMTRRSLICDLDAQVERPELRTFAFDPVERALADRGRYVSAALTVVRAFIVAGAKPDMPNLASFAGYSATVRGALVWLGHPDPAISMERAREDDPELGELRDVMQQWALYIGLNVEATTKAFIRLADERMRDDDTGRELFEYARPELRDSLLAVAGSRSGIDSSKFGKWLRSRKNRVVTLVLGSTAKRVRFETTGLSGGTTRWKLQVL